MAKIRVDGVEYEATEQVAQLFEKVQTGLQTSAKEAQAKLDAATKELEQTKAKMDAASEELKKRTEELKAAPTKIREELEARMDLEEKARGVLGAEAKLDALSDRDVKLLVLTKLSPAAKLDGKSDDYVQARFDSALELAAEDKVEDRGSAALAAARSALVGHADSDGPTELASDAYAKMVASHRNAWKTATK